MLTFCKLLAIELRSNIHILLSSHYRSVFQNLTSALRDQEHLNNSVPEEIKTSTAISFLIYHF